MHARSLLNFIVPCLHLGASLAVAQLVELAPPDAQPRNYGIAIANSGAMLVRSSPDRGGALYEQDYLRAPDGTYQHLALPGEFGAINDAGTTGGRGVSNRPVLRTAAGGYTYLSPDRGIVRDINSAGQAAGSLIAPTERPRSAFFFDPTSGMTLIPAPEGARFPDGVCINSSGMVIGNTQLLTTNRWSAFTWTAAAGSVLLPTIDMEPAEVTDVNDAGVVTGVIGGLGASIKATRWNADGSITVLPSGSNVSWAASINSTGDIVGVSWTGGPQAVLWPAEGGIINLNDLLTPAQRTHWDLYDATGMNDSGQIVGSGMYDPDGWAGPLPATNRAFLLNLQHMPEPTTAVPAFMAVALALADRRRRCRR